MGAAGHGLYRHLWAVRARCPLPILVDCCLCLCPPPSLCRSCHRHHHRCRRCRRHRCCRHHCHSRRCRPRRCRHRRCPRRLCRRRCRRCRHHHHHCRHRHNCPPPEHHCFHCCRGARLSPARGLPRRCRYRCRRQACMSPARGLPRSCSCLTCPSRAWPRGGSEYELKDVQCSRNTVGVRPNKSQLCEPVLTRLKQN